MRKILLALTPVVLLLSAGAQAASNGEIEITASVVAGTCDIALSRNTLDLGNYSVKTLGTSIDKPLADSTGSFALSLNKCDAPAKTGDTASVIVSGPVVTGTQNLFNGTGVGADTGIMLSTSTETNKYIANGDSVVIATAEDIPDVNKADLTSFDNQSVIFNVGVASHVKEPKVGVISAPLLFSFSYN
ncbi:fimbrial protein [Yersinia thracica]|uniref:fimbrial protein n=1 Tax=Yersinia thracica TaxID=2890319 RepID=UPI00119D8CD1|nr:type 1 fimbrial protein [Yersinia thracica]